MAGDSPLQRGAFLGRSGIDGGRAGGRRDRSHSRASKAGPTSVANGSIANGRVQGIQAFGGKEGIVDKIVSCNDS